MNELLNKLQEPLLAIAFILLTYLGNRLRLLVDSKIDKENQAKINDIVKGVVAFVEQVAKVNVKLESEEKLELAKEKALEILNEKGLTISESELEMLIESFVLGLKNKDKESGGLIGE